MIQPDDVRYLFEDLWPAMPYSGQHKERCLSTTLFPRIENCFKKWGHDYNTLLDKLTELDGIGLTISSGLIWSVDPYEAVPFDKYTMSYALHKEILMRNRISDGKYEAACEKIVAYCNKVGYDVEDFVVEAREQMIDSEWLIEAE